MMKAMLWMGAVSVLLAGALHAQDVVGDWHGTLKTGGPELRLVLHIAKGENGGLKATMDSVDQGANGIPVTSATLDGSNLKLTIDAVRGSYEGKVNADATSIAGTWTQGQQPLPLEFTRGTFPVAAHKAAKPSDIDGTWAGTLDLGAKLRIIFHIVNTEDGLMATADSPDQGAKGMPVTTVTRNGSSLKLEMKTLAAEFEGTISPDLKTIAGTFTQRGNGVPLVLSRVPDAAQ